MRIRSAVLVTILGCVAFARFPGRVAADGDDTPLAAQVRAVYDLGAAGLTQALERLATTASALHTGAHPDDEDSAFIARTARGDHARVAYLSLNRGEGGQNIIGTELFDALGVIRTEELLQARRLDGGEQFFTRAFDFGFSKTRAETASRNGTSATCSATWSAIIRMFRPLVDLLALHWHHRRRPRPPSDGRAPDAAGVQGGRRRERVSRQLANEGLRPWQAKKLYRNAGRAEPRRGPAGPRSRNRQRGSGARPQLRGDRRRRPQSAQVAGDGLASNRVGPRTIALRARSDRVTASGPEALDLRRHRRHRARAWRRSLACRRERLRAELRRSTPPPRRRCRRTEPLNPCGHRAGAGRRPPRDARAPRTRSHR